MNAVYARARFKQNNLIQHGQSTRRQARSYVSAAGALLCALPAGKRRTMNSFCSGFAVSARWPAIACRSVQSSTF